MTTSNRTPTRSFMHTHWKTLLLLVVLVLVALLTLSPSAALVHG